MKTIESILKEALTPFWYERLLPIILKNKNHEYFFSDEDKFFPDFKNMFNAVNNIDFEKKVQVVVFGQDPYPRKESATGYAFWDGKIKDWSNPLSPSFKNIIKSILIHNNMVTQNSNIKEMRDALKKNNVFKPDEFFKNSIENGLIWLNASLTFESKDQSSLNKHLRFWKPIIEVIIDNILLEIESVIFIFWGSKSLKFKDYIEKKNIGNYYFVENCHPMLESFHIKNTFDEISDILKSINHEDIKWLG
jgi:uracil DNA glycosylase